MIRGLQQAAPSIAQGGNQRPNATTPTVDMSHLTEEERIMIQSVMAKAEMVDIGMPVDTSMPSRTNLPSTISQALTQQRSQQQQQQQQQQQMRQQQQTQNILQGNQLPNSMAQFHTNQQNQHLQLQPALQIGQLQQNQQQHDQSMFALHQQNQNYAPTRQTVANQGPLQQNVIGQYPGVSMMTNQAQPMQGMHNQQLQQPQQMSQALDQGKSADLAPLKDSHLPLLGQQTQQLVNQINSQFNLGGSSGQQTLENRQLNQANRNNNFTSDSNMRNVQPQQTMQYQSANNQHQLLGHLNHSNMSHQNIIALQQQQQQQQLQQQQLQQQQLQQQQLQRQHIQPSQSIYNQQPNQFTNQMQLQPQIVNQQIVDGIQQTSQLSLPSNQCATTPGRVNQILNSNMRIQDATNQNLMGFNQIEPMNRHQVISQDGNYLNWAFSENAPNQAALNLQMATSFNNYDLMNQQIAMSQHQRPVIAEYSLSGQREPKMIDQTDVRQGIRFKAGPLREIRSANDHALSDQEIFDERATNSKRDVRDRNDQKLRRYDSLDTSRLRSKVSRRHRRSKLDELPQSHDIIQREIPLTNSSKSRQLPELGDLNRHAPQQQQQVMNRQLNQRVDTNRSGQRTNDSRHQAHSRQLKDNNVSYPSDSDSDEEWESLGELADKKSVSRSIADVRESPKCVSRGSDLREHVKDEKTLLKLSELKLNKKANQVMEQQQLLIKQSQDLIKLQQVQLEQRSKVKETKGEEQNVGQQPVEASVQKSDITSSEMAKNRDGAGQKLVGQSSVDSRIATNGCRGISAERASAENSQPKSEFSAFVSNNDDSERVDKINRSFSKATSISSIDLINIEDDTKETNSRSSRQAELRTTTKKTKQTATSYREYEPRITKAKYDRSILRSPTDSTDSEAELVSSQYRTSRRRQRQRMTPTRQHKNSTPRREPVGLPPSVLPVASAMQLHKLHQQHSFSKHEPRRYATPGLNNYFRSKSVCNSPNQYLGRATLDQLIDSCHQLGSRANSPDTLSEFGGQMRRKRLPEPPSNAVPLTPSMVKKMVQAQNAAATNSNKLLTSVNAQSTLITNTHSFHNPCLDRAPNENLKLAMALRNNSKRSALSSYSGRSSGAQVSFVDSKWPQETPAGRENARADQARGAIGSDLSKFIASTYGTSILKNSKSGIVREALGSDKLMGDTDMYYNSGNRFQAIHNSSSPFYSATTSKPDSRYGFQKNQYSSTKPIAIPSRLESLEQTAYSSASTYSPRSLLHQRDEYLGPGARTRRNSEGENVLPSRFERLPPTAYSRQVYFDSTNLGSTHKDPVERNSWSVSSPTRSKHALYSLAKDLPNSSNCRDQSLISRSNYTDRSMSHWPKSYFDASESKSRQFGEELMKEDPTRWSDRSIMSSSYTRPCNSSFRRYVRYQDEGHGEPSRYSSASNVYSRHNNYFDSMRSSMRNPTSFPREQTDLNYSSRLSNFRNTHYRSLDLD